MAVGVGFGITKADIDNLAGSLAVTLRDTLRRCTDLHNRLGDTDIFADDAALIGLGYDQAGVTLLRNAFTFLSLLDQVAHGGSAVPAPVDFFTYAKHLQGVVLS